MFEALATLVKPPSKEMLHAIRFPLLEDVVCGFLGALIFAVAEKKHINLPKKSSKLNSMVLRKKNPLCWAERLPTVPCFPASSSESLLLSAPGKISNTNKF